MLSSIINDFKKKGEVYIAIKARPGAAKSFFREVMTDGTLKIDVAAPAERGKANQELIKFLAHIFEVDKRNVFIINGAGEKKKLIKIIR